MADRYRIDARLGVGPFGTAYKAWQIAEEQHVVLQLLRPSGKEPADGEDFLRIMQKIAEIQEEGILKVRDYGRTDEGQWFVATDFSDGKPVDRIVANSGPMETHRAAAICAAVARTLSAAHAKGVVHAGLTARAVLVGPGESGPEQVRVRDFGLARLLAEPGVDDLGVEATDPALRDLIAGMGPERAVPGGVEPRSDLYALGALLYHLVRGRSLSTEGRQADSDGGQRAPFMAFKEADLHGLEDTLTDVVYGLLAANPEERIQSAEEAVAALDRLSGPQERIGRRTPRDLRVRGDAGRRAAQPTLPETEIKAQEEEAKSFSSTTRLEFGTTPTMGRRDSNSLRPGGDVTSLKGAAAVQDEPTQRHSETAHWVPGRFDQTSLATDEDGPPPKPDADARWSGPPTATLPPWRRTASNAMARSGQASSATVMRTSPQAGQYLSESATEVTEEPTDEQVEQDEAAAPPEAEEPVADANPTPSTGGRAFSAPPRRTMPSNISLSASGAFLPWRDSGGIKPADSAKDLTNSQIMTALEPAEPEPAPQESDDGEAQRDEDDSGRVRSIEDILAVDRFFDGDEKPAKDRVEAPKKRNSSGFVVATAAAGRFWQSERGRWTARTILAVLLFGVVLYLAVWHGQKTPTKTAAKSPTATASATLPTTTAPRSARPGSTSGAAVAPSAPAKGPVAPEGSGGGIDGTTPVAQSAGVTGSQASGGANPTPELELPKGMVRVAAGHYPVGCLATHDRCPQDAMPQHRIPLRAFGIMSHEVTASEYRKCVRAGECRNAGSSFQCNVGKANNGKHPANCVTWQAADAYCKHSGWRLPTEAEWEAAARGMEQKVYPWGSEWPSCGHVVLRTFSGDGCGKGGTSPAGQHPGDLSWVGAHGMGGNVSEWVADDYGPYPGAPDTGAPPMKVWRGGSLVMDARDLVPVYHRGKAVAGSERSDLGFRCAFDLQAE